jgi:hypothetical protein
LRSYSRFIDSSRQDGVHTHQISNYATLLLMCPCRVARKHGVYIEIVDELLNNFSPRLHPGDEHNFTKFGKIVHSQTVPFQHGIDCFSWQDISTSTESSTGRLSCGPDICSPQNGPATNFDRSYVDLAKSMLANLVELLSEY